MSKEELMRTRSDRKERKKERGTKSKVPPPKKNASLRNRSRTSRRRPHPARPGRGHGGGGAAEHAAHERCRRINATGDWWSRCCAIARLHLARPAQRAAGDDSRRGTGKEEEGRGGDGRVARVFLFLAKKEKEGARAHDDDSALSSPSLSRNPRPRPSGPAGQPHPHQQRRPPHPAVGVEKGRPQRPHRRRRPPNSLGRPTTAPPPTTTLTMTSSPRSLRPRQGATSLISWRPGAGRRRLRTRVPAGRTPRRPPCGLPWRTRSEKPGPAGPKPGRRPHGARRPRPPPPPRRPGSRTC